MAGTLFANTQTTREPNLSREFIRTIEQTLGLTFTVPAAFAIQPPTPDGADTFTPEDIFYYAYAIFHSPTYRARYAEFLKIDFPRLPLTQSVRLFRQLARFGYELTQLHLMTHPALNQLITQFPVSGRNEVISGHPRYTEPRQDLLGGMSGRVYINQEQYFEGIAPDVWAFQVGGYQPLDKWLKDRRGRTLTFADILHYQRIVVALKETMRLMAAIDAAIPGWPLDGEGGDDRGDDEPPPEPEPALPGDAAAVKESEDAAADISDSDSMPTPENSLPLDHPIEKLDLFSRRVENAMIRSGILTLRLLTWHTPELLIRNTRNLGEKSLDEIQSVLRQLGLSLAVSTDEDTVTLMCGIASAYFDHPLPRRLHTLVEKINKKRRSVTVTWDETVIAAAARSHPYLTEIEQDFFQFNYGLVNLEDGNALASAFFNRQPDDVSARPVFSPLPDLPAVALDLLDQPLEKQSLFSIRVRNALTRSGVITLRLLIMNTAELLLENVRNLGVKGLAEIEEKLAQHELTLAEQADNQSVTLVCKLTEVMYEQHLTCTIGKLTKLVNKNSPRKWSKARVAHGARNHPYIKEIESDSYQFDLRFTARPIQSEHTEQIPETSVKVYTGETETVTPEMAPFEDGEGKLLLHKLWPEWFAKLNDRQQQILGLRYGIWGEVPATLEEVGNELGLTRERVRQLENKAKTRLHKLGNQKFWEPLKQCFLDSIEHFDGLLTPSVWEHWLNERTVWDTDGPRPTLLWLFSELFDEVHYIKAYNVVSQSETIYQQLNHLSLEFSWD